MSRPAVPLTGLVRMLRTRRQHWFWQRIPLYGEYRSLRVREGWRFGPTCPDKCSSQLLMTTASELRSGKTHRDENFPVASWIIHPRHRALILAFYNFVRTADDIADHAA